MNAPVSYRVTHLTHYEYAEKIVRSRHLAHLSPRLAPWQTIHEHTLEISPRPMEYSLADDYFGNPVVRFAMSTPHEGLRVESSTVLSVQPQLAQWESALPWESARVSLPEQAAAEIDILQFCLPSPNVPFVAEARAFASETLSPGRPVIEALLALTKRINAEFIYDPEATSVTSSVADLVQRRRGVCQDFTHFMLSGLRSLGFAARYMSGYVAPLSGAEANQGAGASHAWVAVYVPGAGWVGCDPTNGKFADNEFITLAWGRDFTDVTPLRGIILARGPQTLRVSVDVTRLPSPAEA
jgi:transglutaminase-like putative cysteine protease